MTYNLKSVDLPVLTGRPLTIFAAALDNRLTRGLLMPKLLGDAGVFELRAHHIEEAPVGSPLYPVPPAAQAAAQSGDGRPDYRKLAHDAGQRMIPAGIKFTTIRDYADAYRTKIITPTTVAERLWAAIEASDEGERPLRTFIARDKADLMAQAKASTERYQQGNPISIFDGVPIAIKDELDQTPYPTTVGTKFLGTAPATEDATAVARLRATGALLIGKANMHEIGIYPNSHNVHHGTVRNPYNRDYDAGGSSSGPAAAVTIGFCPVALGADGGGSIRVPAALCGVVGLKPTYGRVSEHGAAPLDWSIAHIGPIGASVEDVALTYAVIAGVDDKDPNTRHQPPAAISEWLFPWMDDETVGTVRIGIYREWFNHAAPEIVAANEAMVQKLADYGAEIKEIDIPELNEMRIAHAVAILSEMAASMEQHADHWHDFAAPTRINLAFGQSLSSYDYVQSQRMRARAMAIFARIFEDVDVIVTPATAVTAPIIPPASSSAGLSDLKTATELMRYMIPGNLAGLPAITFPVGYADDGLPISMQVIGRPWQEDTLLRVAHAVENMMERKLPLGYFDIMG